jgi:hypothetical protein
MSDVVVRAYLLPRSFAQKVLWERSPTAILFADTIQVVSLRKIGVGDASYSLLIVQSPSAR